MDTTDSKDKSNNLLEVTDKNVTEDSNIETLLSTDPLFLTIIFIVQIVAQILIIFGNSVVIVAILKFPSLHSNMFQFIFSLAVADLLVGISLVIHTVSSFPVNYKENGIVICAAVNILIVTSLVSSVLNMTCIAIDRSLAINCPLQYHTYMSQRNIRVTFIIIWAISFTAGAMLLVGRDDWEVHNCSYVEFYPEKYRLFLIIFFFSMIVSLIFLYVQLFIIAHKQQRKIANQTLPKETKAKSNMKAVKLLMTVLGLFLVCWIPLMVNMTVIYVVMAKGGASPLGLGEFHMTYLLATFNSVFNPIIYAWKNMKIRRAFFTLLHIPFCWDVSTDDTSNNLSAGGSQGTHSL